MPDLRPAQKFARQLSVFEGAFQAEVRRYMNQARGVLIEQATREGVSSPYLLINIRRELDDLRRRVSWLTRVRSESLDDIAAEMARVQIELVRKVRQAAPPFDQARGPSAAERKVILDNLVENITNFIGNLELQISTELGRLRAGNEDINAVIDRLFSDDLGAGRASVWRNAANTMLADTQVDLWTAATGLASTYYLAGQAQAGQRWQKQAIAAIDERTTDCCLRAHGQVQELNKPFQLTGTPRFADRMQHPPFHWNCRTSESLWIEEFEQMGEPTSEMREAARAEIEAREKSGRREIHPAHATSRRS